MPASLPKTPPRPHRPDTGLGVFETILVLDGRPVELDAHLARLESSLAALYPDRHPPPLDVPGLTHPYGPSTPGTSSRGAIAVRIAVAPGEAGELAARVEAREAPPREPAGVALRSAVIPGGLGRHKWGDRRVLDGAGALPLIFDVDGAALEASRASLFAVRDGALRTPPLDGRILPGVTRARAIELAAGQGIEVHETGLERDDLLAAEEVFLTGSLRGVERVRSLDGAELVPGGKTAGRLATALRRAWSASVSGRTGRSGG